MALPVEADLLPHHRCENTNQLGIRSQICIQTALRKCLCTLAIYIG